MSALSFLVLAWLLRSSHCFLSSSDGFKQEWMEDIALNTGCYAETLSLYDHRRLMRAGSHFVLGEMHNEIKAVPVKVRLTVPFERINFSDMTVKAAHAKGRGGKKQDPLVSPDFLPLHFMGLLRVAFASTADHLYLWNDYNLLDVETASFVDPETLSKEALEQNRMQAVTIRNEIRTLSHVALRLGDILNDEGSSKGGKYLSILKNAIENIVIMMQRMCLKDGRFGLLRDIMVTKNVYDSNEIRATLLEMLFLDGIKEAALGGDGGVPTKNGVEIAIYKSYVTLVLTPLFLRRGSDAFNECALRNSTESKRQVIYYNTTAYGRTDPTVLSIYVSEQQLYTSIGTPGANDDPATERYFKRWMHSKALPAGSTSFLTDELSDRLSSYTTMIMRCRGGPSSAPDADSSIQVCTNGSDTCSLVDVNYHTRRSLGDCSPVRFTLFPYNNVITIAMSLSANLVHTGRPATQRGPEALLYDSSLCGGAAFSDLPRALVAGLGGGELPSLLALKHACLVVDVVEVSETVYHAAQSALGFTACGLERGVASLDYARWGRDSCRLNVILSDFLEYMDHISTSGLRKYDFVITDVFNSTAIEWDGSTGTGVSNADIDRFAEANNLKVVKSILKPETGLLLTHLHHDSYYEGFFNALKHEFESSDAAGLGKEGRKYVAVFKKNSNSNVIVAAASGFSTSKKGFVLRDTVDASGKEEMQWPCSNLGAFAEYSVQYALRHGYSPNLAYSHRFSATCIEGYDQ